MWAVLPENFGSRDYPDPDSCTVISNSFDLLATNYCFEPLTSIDFVLDGFLM